MKTLFVTRHQGAIDWAIENGYQAAEKVSHFGSEVIEEGDTVLGVLPIHLACEVVSKGGRYFHLQMDVPAEARGKEFTAEDMKNYGATLQEYIITKA